MIAPRSAAANPTSVNTSTAASRIFRRVASDRTWRAMAYYLRSSGCALSFRTVGVAPFLTWKESLTGRRAGPDRSPDGDRPRDHVEPASADVLAIAIFERRLMN